MKSQYFQTYNDILKANLDELKSKYPIYKIGFFGSITREDFDPIKSDIDILVELNGDIDWRYFELYDDLKKLFPKNKIDLVSRGAIPDIYWPFIKDDLIYA